MKNNALLHFMIDLHNMTEILLKVALNTITHPHFRIIPVTKVVFLVVIGMHPSLTRLESRLYRLSWKTGQLIRYHVEMIVCWSSYMYIKIVFYMEVEMLRLTHSPTYACTM
jgi:hypothetical protein